MTAKNKKSAGILLYRFNQNTLEVLLVHPGGPYWKNKEFEVWSIPKGEFEEGESALAAAMREFNEETGGGVAGNLIELLPVTQRSGKVVYAWAAEGDINAEGITSNMIQIEWPPRSGKRIDIPEVDKAGWFAAPEAKKRINPGQVDLVDQLVDKLQHML